MILVVGATGSLGELICRRLTSADRRVRAMVRTSSDPKKIERLIAMGAEIVYGDLKDAKTLESACAGADAVITTATAIISRQEGDTIESVDREGSIALIDAACTQNVSQFIYLSFPEMPDQFPLQNAKRSVETKLQKSNIAFTILRPTFFMETWLSPALGFDPVNGNAVMYGNGDGAVSWISINDVAEAAVRCLDNPKMKNEIVELGGPEARSPKEVISAFEKAGIGPVSLTFYPENLIRDKKSAAADTDAGVDPFQQSIDAFLLNMVAGKRIDMSETTKTLSMPLTSIDEYVRTVISLQSK